MPVRATSNEVIVQACELRRHFLPALLHQRWQPPGDRLFHVIEGWKLFLRVERCAVPLATGLENSGYDSSLPGPFADILRTEQEWEAQRIASAKSQLGIVADWARRNNRCPVVLKGGLAATGSMPLDLNDIDILLPATDHESLFDALVATGHYPPHGAARIAHYELWLNGGLAVEIHDHIYGGLHYPAGAPLSGAAGVPGFSGLWQLSPGDNLWHLLLHNVEKTPERRGRIRDLLLMRAALDRCNAEDLEGIRREIERRELSDLLRETLDCIVEPMAAAVGDGTLGQTALLGYLLAAEKRNSGKVYPTYGMVNHWVYALLGDPFDRKQYCNLFLTYRGDLSPRDFARYLQLRVPGMARLLWMGRRYSQTVLHLILASFIAWRLGRKRKNILEIVKAA